MSPTMSPKIWLCVLTVGSLADTSCPLTGSRTSPANVIPNSAHSVTTSVLMQYKVWNSSQMELEQMKEQGAATMHFRGPEGGGLLQVGESFSDMDEYVLQRLRVAMPSEHTLLGRHFPIEVQLWHEPAIHRDIRMLIADRTKVQQMLRRFQELTQDWQGELQQLEDPADNESFPDLQTEQDWAESVRQHSVKDGAFLMEHVQQLHERILQIDQQVELLNARLQRPESARMVVLSLFYWTPHTAETEAGEVLKWLHQSVTRNVEAGAGAMENRTQPQAVTEELRKKVQHLEERLKELQGDPGEASVRQLRAQRETEFGSTSFDFDFKESVQRKDTLTAFGYEGSFTRPPCTPVVRWFLISEPQAARAKDILGLADVLRSDQSTECQQAEGLEVCGLGLRPSDGVWWRGPIKQTPKSPRSLPDLPMRTASLGFGSFHKPKETHLSAQLVSQLPWPYVQACCAVLLLCSVAMLGTTCSMWSNQCCDQ